MSFSFSLAPSLSALVNLSLPESPVKEPVLSANEIAAANLEQIGAITVDLLLKSAEAEHRDISYQTFGLNQDAKLPYITEIPKRNVARGIDQLLRLEEACREAFGEDVKDGLRWDFSEDKPYKLTVMIPDGTTRVFQCEGTADKADAKHELARLAIEGGVLDFFRDKESPMSTIEKRFSAHRSHPSRMKFFYFNADGNKVNQNFGAILKVQLSATSFRLYFAAPVHKSSLKAKYHCSELAIEQGILQYIESETIEPAPSSEGRHSTSSTPSPVDLETFFSNLPRPFTDKSFDRTVQIAHSQANNQLTDILKSSPNFHSAYYRVTEANLNGCVFRIDDSDSVAGKTYLIEPCFSKLATARSAITVQAMADGLKDFLLKHAKPPAGGTSLQSSSPIGSSSCLFTLTPAVEALATKIWPQIYSMCRAMKTEPEIEFRSVHVDGVQNPAWGCTMTVCIPPEELAVSDSAVDPKRQYTVPSVYERKALARVAICCLAAKEGILEFLSQRGLPTQEKHPITLQIVALLDRTGLMPGSVVPGPSLKSPNQSPPTSYTPTPAIEMLANKIWSQILSLCSSAKFEPEMDYSFVQVESTASWGCSMTICIPLEKVHPNLGSTVELKRQYMVSPAYKRKAWARMAVSCIAARDGVLEFLYHRGCPTLQKHPLTLQITALLEEQENLALHSESTGTFLPPAPAVDSSGQHPTGEQGNVFTAAAPTAAASYGGTSGSDKGKGKRKLHEVELEEGEISDGEDSPAVPTSSGRRKGKKRSKKRKGSNVDGEVEDKEVELKRQEEAQQKWKESIVNEEVKRFRLS
ncbi:hypothetical protein D9758_011100 [Tetrapyrgos nigripes]|uniref:Uncharacterized protein n=1 Tax=Tetrapyrgos nigripes TaxID=182062 RepID=A0A8H5FSL4_9AGAR|nr:hypothetical protein D9758_011100 [Tetrapyrgos nigripes]